ncbi:MAG: hypothetical protein IJH31_00075 [Erysipelotrichaceae bacterium]|nr:hypothetical protein [Erysipelotrichaceae bacterium]
MKKRKINYWNLGIVLMVLSMIILLILTPLIVHYAQGYRLSLGYSKGIGGEWITWLYPLCYLIIYKAHKEESK